MVLRIFMKTSDTLVLVNAKDDIRTETARNIYAYNYFIDKDVVTEPILLLNILRRNPYLKDPSEEDGKRLFELSATGELTEIQP